MQIQFPWEKYSNPPCNLFGFGTWDIMVRSTSIVKQGLCCIHIYSKYKGDFFCSSNRLTKRPLFLICPSFWVSVLCDSFFQISYIFSRKFRRLFYHQFVLVKMAHKPLTWIPIWGKFWLNALLSAIIFIYFSFSTWNLVHYCGITIYILSYLNELLEWFATLLLTSVQYILFVCYSSPALVENAIIF